MFDHILFPTDGSEGAGVVLDHVLEIAAANDGTVHLLSVADSTQPSTVRIGSEIVDTLEREAERIVSEAADRARERGVATTTAVLQGEPYSTIVGYADERDVDLIAMATRGRRGLGRFLLGSTTERVLRRADVPVLAVRPGDAIAYPYRNVLVPTDGSDCARRALESAIGVAGREEATLHLLTVLTTTALGVDFRGGPAELEGRASELIEDATAVAEDGGVESVSGTVEQAPSVHRAIHSYVDDHDVDLIVLGTHGRTGFDRYVLGSVAEHVVRTAPVPVLTVRGPAETAHDDLTLHVDGE